MEIFQALMSALYTLLTHPLSVFGFTFTYMQVFLFLAMAGVVLRFIAKMFDW